MSLKGGIYWNEKIEKFKYTRAENPYTWDM